MLTLAEGLKDHPEDPLVCFDILTVLNVVQTVADTVGIVDVRQQGRRQLVIRHIRFLTLDLLDELVSVLVQHNLSQVASFISAELQEVVFEDAPHYVQGRDRRLDIPELIPQSGVGVLNRIVVFFFGRDILAMTFAELDSGNVVVLPNHVIWLITLLCNQGIQIHNLKCGDKKPLLTEETVELLTSPGELAEYKDAITEAMLKGTKRNVESEDNSKNAVTAE